jgi:hypothetical protein
MVFLILASPRERGRAGTQLALHRLALTLEMNNYVCYYGSMSPRNRQHARRGPWVNRVGNSPTPCSPPHRVAAASLPRRLTSGKSRQAQGRSGKGARDLLLLLLGGSTAAHLLGARERESLPQPPHHVLGYLLQHKPS